MLKLQLLHRNVVLHKSGEKAAPEPTLRILKQLWLQSRSLARESATVPPTDKPLSACMAATARSAKLSEAGYYDWTLLTMSPSLLDSGRGDVERCMPTPFADRRACSLGIGAWHASTRSCQAKSLAASIFAGYVRTQLRSSLPLKGWRAW